MGRRRVLICGSRDWSSVQAIEDRIQQLPADTLIIQGGAKGADEIARWAGVEAGHFVVEVNCADEHWEAFGKRAGYLRNCAMLDLEPDVVIAFSTGSKGTQLTIDEARRRGIRVEVHGQEVRDDGGRS